MSGHGPRQVFTEEQADAIARREGPLLVSAAAGSGKTSVLVERFVRMVTEDGIAPASILVITFTEKAAGELRSRIRRQLLERGERTLAQDAEGAWISTFHGFCARVLRAHAVAAGLDPAFTVLDEAAGRELREAAYESAVAGLLGAPEDPSRADALDLVAGYGLDRLKRTVLDVFGQLRSAGQERPRLPDPPPAPDPGPLRMALANARTGALTALEGVDGKKVGDARAAIERCATILEGAPTMSALGGAAFKPGNTGALKVPACEAYLEALSAFRGALEEAEGNRAIALIDELLGRYADAYADAKRERSAVDFDDLELMVAGLFERLGGLAAAWAARFERIMVDEFQDTNALQVALLDRLESGHTFRVGDELQSIYGFRHASVEVFRRARERLARDGAVALLRRNFRTRAEVLAAINAASSGLHADFEPLVAGRDDAAAGEVLVELLLTDAQNGNWEGDEHLGKLPGGPSWRWAEARLLAQRVAELVESGRHAAGEIVVLVRAATDIACYERAIEERGISTLASGGRGFWARQQVQDLTQYLATLANPRDEPALLGVLASPLGPGLSSDALALLAVGARAAGHGLWAGIEGREWEATLPPEDGARLAAWVDRFAAERAAAPRLSLAELLTRAIDASGYDEHVLRLPGGVRRLANVRKLIRLATSYERDVGRGVRGFIDRATAELEAEAREADAPVELAGFDAVRLMTIHAAKGLEFPVVVVADLGRDPNTNVPDVLVDGARVGLRIVTLNGKADTRERLALKEERLVREREESLRVFHVAVTRAQERLILSGAASTKKWPSAENCAPIGWLMPAFFPNLAARLAEDGPVLEEAGVRATLNAPGNGVLRPLPAAPAGDRVLGSGGSPTTRQDATLAAPAPPPPVSALSYSALSRFAQCGYRFYLERVLRLPEQDAPPMPRAAAPSALDPLVRGSIAHELLEELELPDDERIREQGARHEIELTDADVADIHALVQGGLDSEIMRRARDAKERHVEEAFTLALVDHPHVPLFNGFVDLRAVEADGGALVVDYKTDRLDGADPEAMVEKSYGVQRRLYALAALRAGAPHVEVAHLYLERPAHPAVARYEASEIPELEARLALEAGDVLSGRFAVAELPHRDLCATCPGRGGLCSWPEEVTLRSLAAAES
ncbi:MAG: family ATPase [Solirubrobacterales bacterium]|nr:family ATPase [Solirubrobacterales bacterium]